MVIGWLLLIPSGSLWIENGYYGDQMVAGINRVVARVSRMVIGEYRMVAKVT